MIHLKSNDIWKWALRFKFALMGWYLSYILFKKDYDVYIQFAKTIIWFEHWKFSLDATNNSFERYALWILKTGHIIIKTPWPLKACCHVLFWALYWPPLLPHLQGGIFTLDTGLGEKLTDTVHGGSQREPELFLF